MTENKVVYLTPRARVDQGHSGSDLLHPGGTLPHPDKDAGVKIDGEGEEGFDDLVVTTGGLLDGVKQKADAL